VLEAPNAQKGVPTENSPVQDAALVAKLQRTGMLQFFLASFNYDSAALGKVVVQ
jgi:hypothetical protein